MTEGDSVPTAHLRLFGDFGLLLDGKAFAIPRGVPRAIIARLGVADATVAADELVASIWDDPPATAAATLRSNLSRLRSAGLGSLIAGGRGGYRLDPDLVSVDVVEFRWAAERALLAPDPESLAAAQALFDGEPLVGIDAPFAPDAAALLHDLHRRLVEALAPHWIERDPGRALAVLPAIVERHPDRELPARALARALARVGRTSEALDVIDAHGGMLELRDAVRRNDPLIVSAPGGPVVQIGVPNPLTRFIGRSAELADLQVQRSRSRLVTLTGPGGAGKTRLAIESLRTAPERTRWYLDLVPLSDAEGIRVALAERVGTRSSDVEALAASLAAPGSLLVLDNADHVLEHAADLVVALLQASPGLNVLVTSREPLRVPGERLFPLVLMAGERADDGLELFVDRAMDASGDVLLDDRWRRAAERVVDLVEGLPLALELAAARLDVLSVGELVRSLEIDGALDVTGRPGSRHASVRATLEWSIRQLHPSERELLVQLAGFAGPVALDDIVGVCRLKGADVRDTTIRLAQKSLVQISGDGARSRLFRLLESVRAVASESGAPGEQWRLRHAQWFARRAERFAQWMFTPRVLPAIESFAVLRADLALAYETALELESKALALDLAGSLANYWVDAADPASYLDRVDEAIALPGSSDDALLARCCAGGALIARRIGLVDRMVQYAELGLPPARRAGDRVSEVLLIARSARQRVRAQAERAIVELSAVDDVPDWVRCELALYVGMSYSVLGRHASALTAFHESMEWARRAGFRGGVEGALMWIGITYLHVKRAPEALDAVGRMLQSIPAVHDPQGCVLGIRTAASVLASLDEREEALTLFAFSDALAERLSLPRSAYVSDDDELRIAQSRASVLPDRARRLHEDGRALTLDQAIATVQRMRARHPVRTTGAT